MVRAMTSTSVRSGSRRAAAALSAGSLALLALAVVPPPAGAASPEISYSCPATDGVSPFVLPVVLDTSLPQRMTTGQATQVVMTATATLPGATAREIATKHSATALDATLTPQVAFGTAPAVSPVFKVLGAPISDQSADVKADRVVAGLRLHRTVGARTVRDHRGQPLGRAAPQWQ